MISDTTNTNKAKLAKIRVAVRIRPPLPREIGGDGKFLSCVGVGPNTEKGQTIFINSSEQPVLLGQSQGSGAKVSRYTFDKIFPVNVCQEDVYTYTMEPLVRQVAEGYNATVLAYGQTGSGKTHTILGEGGKMEGLAGRTVRALLQKVKTIKLSVLQIYQEAVFDLLSSTADSSLCLRQSHSGVTVENLKAVEINSVQRAGACLEAALSRRAVGGTLLNEVSSRSHMIITISVSTEAGTAKLNLVDLAGSERLTQSGAEGQRLQETCAINSSLFALVAVVESLSSSKPFIPYRNSKLTWILSDSIGGNSLTTILAAISPSQKYAKETKSTLKFAHSCKKIEHLVFKNEHKTRTEMSKKLRPLKTEMPWKKNVVDVKSALVETCLGPVCCYYAGPAEGPPVIIMHGCPSSFGEFQHFLPCLTHYGFRVIGFDQPGYGNSPGVRANSRSDKAMEKGGPVDVLKEIIKHHSLAQLPTLLGYDWGGGIALTFAVLYPARVRRVISFLPSFSETPETQLHHMKTPTMILWVKRDQNHSWKRFKAIANKIPGVRIEFVDCPNQTKEASRNCYEKISDNILAPIVDFLGKNDSSDEKAVYKTKEITTKSTVGDTVIEICNINFEDDTSPEEIDEMMSRPNPEVNAVILFKNLGLRYGFEELYRAEENHTHKLHKVVTSVFRALPSLNPTILHNNYEDLVHLGIIDSLPRGLEEMMRSPRYFPGRKVLIKASELERVYSASSSAEGGITKISTIVEVSDHSCQVALDPYENYGREVRVEVSRRDLVTLNNPHVFHVEPTGKFAFEDGLHCDYEKKIVKAKTVEIGFQLSKLISKLDFLSENCLDMQKEAIVRVRSCLNLITFQAGVDRSRVSRSDCAGRLAIYGQVCRCRVSINSRYEHYHINQGHCHGVSSTMASFLLPFAPLLGLDLKYRGVYTFENGEERKTNNSVERHQCLEVTSRPSCHSFIIDLWNAEKYDNQSWLSMDMDTAYNRFMYPNGALILKTRPQPESNFDFSNQKPEF